MSAVVSAAGFLGPRTSRLVRLYLTSRQVPGAMAVLAGAAVVLRIALQAHWIRGAGADSLQMLLLIECGAACAVAVVARNPFGESEETTGRLLPRLRLGTAMMLSAAAVGILALGAAGTPLPGGWLALPRDVAALVGVGLISAQVLGGALAWAGPLAYTVVTEVALLGGRRTAWIWLAQPAHDPWAGCGAGLIFATGTALLAVRNPGD